MDKNSRFYKNFAIVLQSAILSLFCFACGFGGGTAPTMQNARCKTSLHSPSPTLLTGIWTIKGSGIRKRGCREAPNITEVLGPIRLPIVQNETYLELLEESTALADGGYLQIRSYYVDLECSRVRLQLLEGSRSLFLDNATIRIGQNGVTIIQGDYQINRQVGMGYSPTTACVSTGTFSATIEPFP